MFVSLSYLILLIAVVLAEKQTKLEDIERDNLSSERRANKHEPSAENAGNKLNDDKVYVQLNTGIGQEYPRLEQSSTIHYVTPQQYENAIPYTHPVHEEANMHMAGSRESLTNLVVRKTSVTPSPYLSQQPSYVYVQAGSQKNLQNGVITYDTPQHLSANTLEEQQKSAGNDISYAPLENHIQVDTSQQNDNIASHYQNYQSRILEYIPLLSQISTVPSYIMLIRSPTHAPTYGFSNVPIQYASSTVMPSNTQTNASPTLSAYIARTIDERAVLTALESAAIPAATLPSKSIQSNPIEYNTQTAHCYSYPFTPSIDIYGSLQAHKHPSNLLDSYIPSSTILAIQRQKNGGLMNRPSIYIPPNGFYSPLVRYSSSLYQQGSHQPGYNTIAYSTAQSYSKRSPKFT